MHNPFPTSTLVMASTGLGFTTASALYDRDLSAYVCLAVAAALFCFVASRYRADRQTSITYDPSVGILLGMTQDELVAIRNFFSDLNTRQRAAGWMPSVTPATSAITLLDHIQTAMSPDDYGQLVDYLLDHLDPETDEALAARLTIDRAIADGVIQ